MRLRDGRPGQNIHNRISENPQTNQSARNFIEKTKIWLFSTTPTWAEQILGFLRMGNQISLFLSLSLSLSSHVLIVLEDIRQGIVYRVYWTVGTSFS